MSNRSWVTLATNDSYGLGALVLAHSLRRAGSIYPAAVLITPSVTEAMRERLRAVFAEVVIVDVLDSRDAAHLALLQRPELGITFTKIHCWSLTQYEKCVFLDADTLIVQNCDELFEREELSAAPDVGWPDCFNSGVFVFKPSAETFDSLVKFAQERGSFDGGDQGLLNSFFSDWAHGDINKHLPFLYNVTSAAFYSYLPALKHYGQNLKIIHFIGAAKPWLQQFNWGSRHVEAPEHLREFLQLWWDLFVSQVHSQLDISMSGVAGNLARVALGGGQNEAIDDLTRRQGWEAGNIDYMGADAFENIWAKISQTLSQPRQSPSKQSPPREPAQPAPQPAVASEPVSQEIEVAKEALPIEPPVVPAELPAVVPTEPAAPVEVQAVVNAPAAIEVSSPVAVPGAIPEVVAAAEKVVSSEPETKTAAPKVPAAVIPAAPIEVPESEVPVPVEAIEQISVPTESVSKKTEAVEIKSSPAEAVAEAPKAPATVIATPASPTSAEAAGSPAVPEATPEKAFIADTSDSPPLANTPSKEEAPVVPAAKCPNRACSLM